ncbi:hypothetical protein N5P37_011194 [Trichoderma harzianum]|uniref:Tat pathway signal sequence n=1 Tax=Trichoderma harzianum CBS 226.95 TaxID=983964 RepID=A0A2T3ZW68_TRIHA|nr:hypothetical protein M431DRAFT_319892 [Trichoderma harzianum CBS 226.95]KAK0756279.1 hypothetical protein N5P37_011194 [Trichoderma harzianum]PKK44557.1 hypothetical protein CI102_9395 [Trichoderma harzianum]PTB48973.1 hypothetical protein M431DRAFT_319892 [Trichoderma harzianum CBS 226.95]
MNKFRKQEINGKTISDIDEVEQGQGLLEESSTDTDTDASTNFSPAPRRSRSSNCRWYSVVIGFPVLLCATNLLTFWITASTRPQCHAPASVAEPPSLAPMLRDLNLETIHVKFDSTFYSQGSRYRKPPSPETDAAWNFAGANFGFLLIPEDQASESDLTSDHIHLAGGPDQANLTGIPADVEVFHQLHCLNLLRKATWYNHDYYRKLGADEFQHPDRTLSVHVDHCIDNLRQRIMCTADVGLVPFYWVGDDGQTDPEFSRTHTCRNFETLHDWMMQHMVTLDSNATLLPRPGDYRVDHFH